MGKLKKGGPKVKNVEVNKDVSESEGAPTASQDNIDLDVSIKESHPGGNKMPKNVPVALNSSTIETIPAEDEDDAKLDKSTEESGKLKQTKKKIKKNKNKSKTDKEADPLAATTKEETTKEKVKKQSLNLEDIENTIFIGNLPHNTKAKQLKSLCSKFGTVKAVRFRTKDGKKLFKHKTRKEADSLNAYVVMESIEGAEKSLKLNGIDFKGRHIRVNKAKGYGDEVETKQVILVGNLKYSANDEKLHAIFSSCGEIEYVRALHNNKGCKGVAYVCFKKPESVGLALELNNTMLDDRPIRVERYSVNKLGAMEKRKEAEQQAMSGPRRRIQGKVTNKLGKKKAEQKIFNGPRGNTQQKNFKGSKKGPANVVKNATKNSKKKSEYRGVQMSSKKKFKKKKPGNKMLALAKKIAPKS